MLNILDTPWLVNTYQKVSAYNLLWSKCLQSKPFQTLILYERVKSRGMISHGRNKLIPLPYTLGRLATISM